MKVDQSTSDGKLTDGQTDSKVDEQPNPDDERGFEPAIRISRQRIRKGKQRIFSLI